MTLIEERTYPFLTPPAAIERVSGFCCGHYHEFVRGKRTCVWAMNLKIYTIGSIWPIIFRVMPLAHIWMALGRTAAIAVGGVLSYIALFLYETESGTYQNRLEELWIRIDDLSRTALTRQTAFLKQTLGFLNFGFDSLFGKKLISTRSIAMTLAYSASSLYLMSDFFNKFSFREDDWQTTLGCLGLSLLELLLGTSLAFIKNRRVLLGGSWTVIFFTLLIPIAVVGSDAFKNPPDLVICCVIALIIAAAVSCDVAFIALNRAMLNFTAKKNSSSQIAALLVCNGLVAFGYMAPYLLIDFDPFFGSTTGVQAVIWLISITNLFTVLLASGMFIVMLVALLHRMFWPVLSRPLYAMARYGFIRNQKLLLAISLVLLAWAIPAWRTFWEVIGKIK